MSLYTIAFTQIAIKSISKYKKSNPVQYKKLVSLLSELMELLSYSQKHKVLSATRRGDFLYLPDHQVSPPLLEEAWFIPCE